MIVRWLIWLLERAVTSNYQVKGDQVDEWLVHLHTDDGFKEYFKWRDYMLLKTLGQGQKHEEYLVAVGRRLELLFLLGKAKDEYDKMEKKKIKTSVKK